MPSVSIVVPVFNGASTIGDMLQALVHQSWKPASLEILVVDNGSTDETCAVVERFDVTVLTEATRGPAAARNRGLRHAGGELIVHVDADTLPTRTWLREIVAPFVDPEVVIVGGQTRAFRPETAAERFIARVGIFNTERDIVRPLFPFAASLNMAVRRHAELAIGGWSEDMQTSEDVDFCHRLLQTCPGRMVYQPSAILFHRNRRTDEALFRQAWMYGQGAAHLYRRYPAALPWGLPQIVAVWRRFAAQSAKVPWLYLGRRLGMTSDEDLEFARYHRKWMLWHWRGFFSYRRHQAYRPFEAR